MYKNIISIKSVSKLILIFLLSFSFSLWAQDLSDTIVDAAKEAQNPLANVISMPLQNNMDFGIGDYNKTANVLNVQPILPVSLTESGWLLINRMIIPIPKTVPDLSSEDAKSTTGLGDISYTAWVAPPVKGSLTWGFGMTSVWPTAGNNVLGQGKYSLGPSVVLVYCKPTYMAAAIISDWKSVGGDEAKPDVHTFYFQYIFTYFLQKKWYVSSAPINLANWEADAGQQWTVPLGGGFGKMITIGKLPLDLQTQAFYNVVRPDGSPEWQWRFQLKFIFPKGKS
jgi:hypothetical protein